MNGRACIAIDAVRATSVPYVADSDLVPFDADVRHWFYPSVDDQPAVFMTGRRVPDELLQQFRDAGVIVKYPPGTTGRCDPATP